ncbi:MAG: hypothetical protein R3Y10_09170 [Ferrimonas sp.]
MDKSALITIGLILVGLGLAAVTMVMLSVKSEHRVGSSYTPEIEQLAQCTAYYQISAGTIQRMGVTDMAPIAEQLLAQATIANQRLNSEIGPNNASVLISQSSEQLMSLLPDPNQLGTLMQRYREPCQMLFAHIEH